MEILSLIAILATIVGIAASIVQVLEYLEKRRKKRGDLNRRVQLRPDVSRNGDLSSLINEIGSRAQAGKKSYQLYYTQCKSKRSWRRTSLLRLWCLHISLNLYDYATGNTPPGGPSRIYHLKTFGRRLFTGFE